MATADFSINIEELHLEVDIYQKCEVCNGQGFYYSHSSDLPSTKLLNDCKICRKMGVVPNELGKKILAMVEIFGKQHDQG